MTTRTDWQEESTMLDVAEELGNKMAEAYGADVAATLLRQAAQHVERAARMRAGDSLLDREIDR